MTRHFWPTLKETFSEWSEDNVSRLSAAVSYYAIFSMAPILLIIIALSGIVLGQEAIAGQLVERLEGRVGPEAAQLIERSVAEVAEVGSGMMMFVGIAVLLVTATGVLVELRESLNTIWGVEPQREGVMHMIISRLLGLLLILFLAALVMAAFVTDALIAGMIEQIDQYFPGAGILSMAASFVLTVAVFTLVFATIFKLLPDAEMAWRDVWVGALLTGLLFATGKILIGLYMGRVTPGSTFGAAGSLVALILWVYYSAQIMFLGAEFTQVYARRYGSLAAVPRERQRKQAHRRSEKEGADERKHRPQREARERQVHDQAPAPDVEGHSVYTPYYTPYVTLLLGGVAGWLLSRQASRGGARRNGRGNGGPARRSNSPIREALRSGVPLDEKDLPDLHRFADKVEAIAALRSSRPS